MKQLFTHISINSNNWNWHSIVFLLLSIYFNWFQ